MNPHPPRARTLAALVVLAAGGLSAAATGRDRTDVPEGKVYNYRKGKRGEIEIHFPKGHDPSRRRVPGIILFHGGAWKRGDLWTKQEFEGDTRVSFEFTRIQSSWAQLVYIQAQGIGTPPYEKDIYAWRELREVASMVSPAGQMLM